MFYLRGFSNQLLVNNINKNNNISFVLTFNLELNVVFIDVFVDLCLLRRWNARHNNIPWGSSQSDLSITEIMKILARFMLQNSSFNTLQLTTLMSGRLFYVKLILFSNIIYIIHLICHFFVNQAISLIYGPRSLRMLFNMCKSEFFFHVMKQSSRYLFQSFLRF